VIATILMVIDHIAHFLIPPSEPTYWIMHMVGRIAAPLFWFCFAEGFLRTSSKDKYILRLSIAAIVMALGNSIICAALGNQNYTGITALTPNIFLTMSLMSMAIQNIELVKENKKITGKILNVVFAILLCLIVGLYAEYKWYAVFSVLCLYFIKPTTLKHVLFIVINVIICILTKNFIQIFMILAVPFIVLYKPEKPKYNMKWLFYVFYPVHCWLLIFAAYVFA
jgi:hypothetical protein